MAHKTVINGTEYEITGGTALIDGTKYQIGRWGRTRIYGVEYNISLSKGILITINPDRIAYTWRSYSITIAGVSYNPKTLENKVIVYANTGDVIRTNRSIITSYPQYYGVYVRYNNGKVLQKTDASNYNYTVPSNISAINIYATDESNSSYGMHYLNFDES